MGYPGIVLDDSGHRVPGFLFKSENLHNYWHLLDEFEGSEYERVPVEVTTSNGQTVQSYLYMLKAKTVSGWSWFRSRFITVSVNK